MPLILLYNFITLRIQFKPLWYAHFPFASNLSSNCLCFSSTILASAFSLLLKVAASFSVCWQMWVSNCFKSVSKMSARSAALQLLALQGHFWLVARRLSVFNCFFLHSWSFCAPKRFRTGQIFSRRLQQTNRRCLSWLVARRWFRLLSSNKH